MAEDEEDAGAESVSAFEEALFQNADAEGDEEAQSTSGAPGDVDEVFGSGEDGGSCDAFGRMAAKAALVYCCRTLGEGFRAGRWRDEDLAQVMIDTLDWLEVNPGAEKNEFAAKLKVFADWPAPLPGLA